MDECRKAFEKAWAIACKKDGGWSDAAWEIWQVAQGLSNKHSETFNLDPNAEWKVPEPLEEKQVVTGEYKPPHADDSVPSLIGYEVVATQNSLPPEIQEFKENVLDKIVPGDWEITTKTSEG